MCTPCTRACPIPIPMPVPMPICPCTCGHPLRLLASQARPGARKPRVRLRPLGGAAAWLKCSRQPMRLPASQAQGCHPGPKRGEGRSDACRGSSRPLRSTAGASRSAPRPAWMRWDGASTSSGRGSTRASWSTSSRAWSSAARAAPSSVAARTCPRRRRCACPRAASGRCRRARCRWTPTTGGANGRAGHRPSR